MSKVRSGDGDGDGGGDEQMEFHGEEETLESKIGYPRLKRQKTETEQIKMNVPPRKSSSGRKKKLDVMMTDKCNPPLDNKQHVHQVLGNGTSNKSEKPKVIRVYSFKDLNILPSQKRVYQAVKTIVEPMECDEVKADTKPLKKHNKRDVSLIERFTQDEINFHLKSLKGGSGQGTVPESGIKETCELMDENDDELCQLCGQGKIKFPAPPICCSICTRRIKEKSLYYVPEEKIGDNVQHQICNPCHSYCKSEFDISGVSISKAKMLKLSNLNNQDFEEWVQCTTCDKWQHQICGLYNPLKDCEKNADYICPHCLLKEHQSLDTGFFDNTDLGAKDLPETILSYFLEKRLFRRLKQERSRTAEANGKSVCDVPEPNDLTLRVVFSADRSSNVNKKFVDLLQKEHYPSEFPYRSKVILLFQKVEGVDVCIFALIVQEFGSECSSQNQRSIYIYYLDSVKYFRPERLTFSGEALRTFVYQEILIGYLEYCKLRGFTTAYIWSCPPQKGDDYILYSHPKTQKNPNKSKLRQWYISMLNKAREQGVVANVTNLYERFFKSKEESTLNVTAARLPYLEGSFWSSNAEYLIQRFEKEDKDKLQKKVQSFSKRKLKDIGKPKGDVDLDDAKKILLMEKLDKLIQENKDESIVVELHYSCTRCSKAILSGWRWFCEKCKNLQLCQKCYDADQELPGEHKHTIDGKEKQCLSKAWVSCIQTTTEDNDLILENDIFESRQGFLTFSEKHNYNFDMLRRAKHSSMMILYHLHTSNKQHKHSQQNSSDPLLQVACTACNRDISNTVYFSCLVCSDYRACTRCYTRNRNLRLLHLFPVFPAAHGTPPRPVGALEMLNGLFHAKDCRPSITNPCSFPKCKDVITLFYHNALCKTKRKEPCNTCNNFLRILYIHAYHCQDPNCSLPYCSDMKLGFTKSGISRE